jgi:signal transduction histidine kinase
VLRYPPALAEVGSEAFRPKLQAGIYTGYATLFALLVVALGAHRFGVLSRVDWALALLAVKLVTNSLAWWALRARRAVIELSALNIAADVTLMTGGVYFTGGPFSPLVSLYFVEVSVMALLTNFGLTVATTIGAFAMFVTMSALCAADVLPKTTSIIPTHPAPAHIAVIVAYVGCVLLAPGTYVALIVQRLRERERALDLRARELVDAARARSEFTANITHELRTPLHGILGMSELLVEEVYGPVTDKQRGAVKAIQSSATSLLELIDSLLVVARQEALALEVKRSRVDLVEVARALMSTATMLVGTRKVTVALELDPRALDRGAVVDTDRPKLVQILVNLVANAVKFTSDGGSVTISLSATEDCFAFAVRDTGCGVPRDALDKIFNPYFQVDGSAVRAHGGAGIGLSVVRALSDLLGYSVAVESELGRGSTFTVRVPRASVAQSTTRRGVPP